MQEILRARPRTAARRYVVTDETELAVTRQVAARIFTELRSLHEIGRLKGRQSLHIEPQRHSNWRCIHASAVFLRRRDVRGRNNS